ncbi:MAG: gamma-glutamyltransferase [Microcystaceae cyanobacterium]
MSSIPPPDAKVAIAASSSLAAEAGATIVRKGGNGVDAAIAATLVSMCTEVGIMAPGGSGFITLTSAGQEPITIDAYAVMPGKGLKEANPHPPGEKVTFDYGGLTESYIGYRSVAVPGIWAGLAQASRHYGKLPWSELLIPAIEITKQGFPLLQGGAEYLKCSHNVIFNWHPQSNQVIYHSDGRLRQKGEQIFIADLPDSLALIAEQGVSAFYQGEIAQKIVAEIQAHHGLLTALDLASYQALLRPSIQLKLDDWQIATNPAPAIGGACLAALLLGLNTSLDPSRNIADNLVILQQSVLNFRQQQLQETEEALGSHKIQRLLQQAQLGQLQSPSTIHTSAVDTEGNACSITASAGYGSGVMVEKTGFWLNNSLGEIELHPSGAAPLCPGTRLVSNMAPTIARKGDGTVLAIGSPGASRITTALSQVLYYFIQQGISLNDAIAHSRLHVEAVEPPTVSYESGLTLNLGNNWQTRPFPPHSMYFGGVQAAYFHPQRGLLAVADERREGGIAYA